METYSNPVFELIRLGWNELMAGKPAGIFLLIMGVGAVLFLMGSLKNTFKTAAGIDDSQSMDEKRNS